jgi:hypothetical protein
MWYYSHMGIKGIERGKGVVRLPVVRVAESLGRPKRTVQWQMNRAGVRGGRDHFARLEWLICERIRVELDAKLKEAVNVRLSEKLLAGQAFAEGDAVGELEGFTGGTGGPADETG